MSFWPISSSFVSLHSFHPVFSSELLFVILGMLLFSFLTDLLFEDSFSQKKVKRKSSVIHYHNYKVQEILTNKEEV